jgi:glycosyltransferase involved in cell wall biosynthesis
LYHKNNNLKTGLEREKILIFGSGTGGHHLKYSAICIEAFHENGHEVSFASSRQTFKSPEYDLVLKCRERKFKAIKYAALSAGPLTVRFEKSWRLLMLLLRHKHDIVFIPYLDNIFYIFGMVGIIMKLFGRRFPEMYGILFNCDFAYPEKQNIIVKKLKKRLFKNIVASGIFRKVLLIDEIAFSYIQADMNMQGLYLCPDPVECPQPVDRRSVKLKLGVPEEAKIIGVFGLINEDKGVDRLVGAFLARGPKSNEYLLLMGKQTTGLQLKIEQILINNVNYSKHIVIVNRFVDDEELLSSISSVDVVAVTYPYHMGSASFLIRAAAAKKPVLGSNTGWIGRIMTKYRLGHSCNAAEESGLMTGLDWAFDKPQDYCQDAEEFASEHTVAKFKEIIINWN